MLNPLINISTFNLCNLLTKEFFFSLCLTIGLFTVVTIWSSMILLSNTTNEKKKINSFESIRLFCGLNVRNFLILGLLAFAYPFISLHVFNGVYNFDPKFAILLISYLLLAEKLPFLFSIMELKKLEVSQMVKLFFIVLSALSFVLLLKYNLRLFENLLWGSAMFCMQAPGTGAVTPTTPLTPLSWPTASTSSWPTANTSQSAASLVPVPPYISDAQISAIVQATSMTLCMGGLGGVTFVLTGGKRGIWLNFRNTKTKALVVTGTALVAHAGLFANTYSDEMKRTKPRFQSEIDLWRELNTRVRGNIDSAASDVVYLSRARQSMDGRQELLAQIHTAIKNIPMDTLTSIDSSTPFKGYKFSLLSPNKQIKMDVFLKHDGKEGWHLILMSRPKLRSMFDFDKLPSDLNHINIAFPGSRNLLRVEIDGLWWHFETEGEAILAFIKMQEHEKVLLVLGRSLHDSQSLSESAHADGCHSLHLLVKEVFANPDALADFSRQIEANVSPLPASVITSQIRPNPGLLLRSLPDAYVAPTLFRRNGISDDVLALGQGETIPVPKPKNHEAFMKEFNKRSTEEKFEIYQTAQGRIEGREIASKPGAWLTTDMTNPTMKRSEDVRYPPDYEKQEALQLEKESENIVAHITSQFAP